jgi:cytochrome c553
MAGFFSNDFPYPHDPAATSGQIIYSASSRLLKIDNRGTCQMCHDPTGTVTTVGRYSPPTPAP